MMKKLLLTTAACGLAMTAAPAYAQVELDLGGYTKMYGAFVDQDENADTDGTTAGVQGAGDTNDFDFIRDTEIHFTGETTLDNGLTVGFHTEADTDGGDGFNVDETYAYFSGNWGRVNLGDEDGAAYLLQVAAPSADSNIDGIRQYVQPVNYTAALGDSNASGGIGDELFTVIGNVGNNNTGNSFDYDQDPTGKSTKITYLSPIMNGFQVGVSYTPDSDGRADDLEGIGFDDVTDTFGDAYEAGLRYEGQFNNVGVILGAGYSHVELEDAGFTGTLPAPAANPAAAVGDPSDDRQVWNVGADFDIGPFGIGAIYREDNAGEVVNIASTATDGAVTDDEETIVVGVDYTTGPFKFGASYYDQENTFGIKDLDTERYSGGVTYTYGPGMTFRGSIGYIEHEATGIGGPTSNDVDATYVTLGTQINF